MALSFTEKKRIRKTFGQLDVVADVPNLLEVQQQSFQSYMFGHDEKSGFGRVFHTLDMTFRSMFPIKDAAETAQMDFVDFKLETPKFDVTECKTRDMTFAAPLRATFRLTLWETDEDSGAKSVKDIKEQEVYLFDMPLMTEQNTFVVNGTERVVVMQMQRSPGVFFSHDDGTTHVSGKLLFNARVIPVRGSWLDFEFDHKDNVYCRIDRRRKLPATYVLRALGLSRQDIVDNYYNKVDAKISKDACAIAFEPLFFEGVKLASDLIDADSKEVLAEAGTKPTRRKMKKIEDAGTKWILQADDDMVGRFIADEVADPETGEVVIEAGSEIDAAMLKKLRELKVADFKLVKVDHLNIGSYLINTLKIDKTNSSEEALIEIYKIMRPGEPPTVEAASKLFQSLFFDGDRYDLSNVGRMKMNARLKLTDVDDEERILRKEDILAVVRQLLEIRDGRDQIDDIDHLANRRVRLVGELMDNQLRIGLLRMERSIKERMSSAEIDTMMPNDLINARPLTAAMREFFASSQLSQFMDQTNPLSEVTHKRRLSALGPGGLTRERAGFEVRDVHPTHYGRICPIETPEGPNIGLINSLATYAKINKYGFIETPFRKVEGGQVSDEIEYMSAINEMGEVVAQANTVLSDKGEIVNDLVVCRKNGETLLMPREEVTYMDVSPRQVVSVAAALIPFLANDDANRALMGSNMQRQAVPLLRPEAPFVGTGMERRVAQDSGITIVAKRSGVVESVDASRIVVRATGKVAANQSGVDVYRLTKFQRSNQNSSYTQRPLVNAGDKVKAGDVIADGPSTDKGELALGRNVLVAFMPWNGYNFEDSILISERIVRDDIYTSIHIDEFEVMSRDTKLGPEEITRDIPNVGEEGLSNLDESGIIRIGAEVKPGDILVGKITPKGETPMTPEEKLLRAIFGEKAADVRDTSLRASPGTEGVVVGVKVFNRRGAEKDTRTVQIEEQEIARLEQDMLDERRILERDAYTRLEKYLVGQKATNTVGAISKGKEISKEQLAEVKRIEWWKAAVADETTQKDIEQLRAQLDKAISDLKQRFDEKRGKVQLADELAPGVLKMVKVFIAVKRKLQPGDKMAGRHGNKGVISQVRPIEDMPFLDDGTPVDMVLNPLGVPSRMNVGQILETHLGWAAYGIGRKISNLLEEEAKPADVRKYMETLYTKKGEAEGLAALNDAEIMEMAQNLSNGITMAVPVFDGPDEDELNSLLQEAGLPESGKVQLHDGRTGEAFEQQTTVGYIYMLKLHHLVDEKIHARSIGPYSLVTQQPLGGKAQFGGQRFGEMEVWALEAYGASYTLQEMLTVKSDDVSGRTKTYEAIIRGEQNFEAGVPESFNVLVKEIQALGLDVQLLSSQTASASNAPRLEASSGNNANLSPEEIARQQAEQAFAEMINSEDLN
jgi:DNA-directed RNA polymerase subunit beta